MSWIIKLGNGFEAKGHLKQKVVVVGVITWGKGHSGWLGRLVAVLWIFLLWIASCSITLQTPEDTLLSLGRCSCLGWGARRRSQPILEQEGARHPAGVQDECGDDWTPSALELHRSGFASHPVMQELPQRVPEASGAVVVVSGGQCQVGPADTALCSQLQSRDSSSLFSSPPLSPLAKDFT